MKTIRSSFFCVFGCVICLIIFCTSCKKGIDPGNNTTGGSSNNPSVPGSVLVSTVAGVNNSGSLMGKLYPFDLALDASGNLYVSDAFDNVVCKIGANNTVSLVAGKFDFAKGGYADGTGANALFNYQHGIVTDASGNIFVCDYSNARIRKVTPTGVVSTFAGGSTSGETDGVGTSASFTNIISITKDASDNLYVAENSTDIRKITPAGVVSTFFKGLPDMSGFGNITLSPSGDFYISSRQAQEIFKLSKTGVLSIFAGSGTKGAADGLGIAATFSFPTGITTDAAGNVYVSDQGANIIRKITSSGMVTTIAGSGTAGVTNGIGNKASFNTPSGLVIDAIGNIYVADQGNNAIRKITPTGVVSTVLSGVALPVDGGSNVATFSQPAGLVSDVNNNIYVADAGNNLIRKISAAGTVTTFAGTAGKKGSADGGSGTATFNTPTGVCFDASGNLFVADYGNNELRKVTSTGSVTSMALFVAANGASGPLNNPTGVAIDANGSIFYTNTYWGTICKIANNLNSTFSDGDPGGFYGKFFVQPYGITVDKSGNVYVADTENSRICKITPTGSTTTVAGAYSSGNFPISGSNNGTGISASFNHPKGIAVDGAGNIYVADTGNNLIRKITPGGVVTTLAGLLTAGSADGNATVASFNAPAGITINAAGTALYVSDTGNGLIRKITL